MNNGIWMNWERAEKVIRFIETLRIPEGMHVGQPFLLRPWQKHVIREVYAPSWPNGLRVVRKAILSVGKKNGKTPLISGLSLGHLCGPEARKNQQLYSAAWEREQSGITYRYMRQMIEMDDELDERLNIKTATKEIEFPDSGSTFKALSSETKGKHGLGPAFLVFDELAQFGADREFYDTLIQGRGAHEEPLLWIISTQAPGDDAVLSQEIDYAKRVQAGEIDDPTIKLFLFTTPEDADLLDEDAWKLSNPALGDFLSIQDMREAANTAKAQPSAEANFRNLRLNQRVDATAQFITREVWQRNMAVPDMATFEDCEVFGGLDLSGKNDLSSLALTAIAAESEAWDVMMRFWGPEDGIRERQERDKAPYTVWRDQGHLIATPGRTVDYAYIARELASLRATINLVAVKFDRWRVDDLRRECSAIGLDAWVLGKDWSVENGERGAPKPDGMCLIPHGQGYQDMSPAVELLEDLLVSGRVRHGNNPVLTWCASNVRVQRDPAGNRKFDKIKSTGRIDGVVALAMALNGAVRADIAEAQKIERGFVDLGVLA